MSESHRPLPRIISIKVIRHTSFAIDLNFKVQARADVHFIFFPMYLHTLLIMVINIWSICSKIKRSSSRRKIGGKKCIETLKNPTRTRILLLKLRARTIYMDLLFDQNTTTRASIFALLPIVFTALAANNLVGTRQEDD